MLQEFALSDWLISVLILFVVDHFMYSVGALVVRKKLRELGPDPVRADADKELVWASMQAWEILHWVSRQC